MKKLISIIVSLIMLLTFSGCGSSISPAKPGYTCNAKISYCDTLNAEAKISVIGGGLFSIEILNPDEIKGLKFNFDNENITINQDEIENSVLYINDFGGFSEILNKAFLSITTGSPELKKKGDTYTYSGNIEGETFIMQFNSDGFPTHFEMEEEQLTAKFSDWKY